MRLHHLDLEAFGPFPGRESLDFDALTDGGLFLLCGPTGAGKTSVLDAVSFALFGQVPGDRDKAKRLHSDHAEAGTGPRVTLEVTIRGRRLRVTRSPEWMRPKKRGSGEVREHTKVLVEERVEGAWHHRSNRVDEAGDLLGSLLGLTMTQFCQVALLPQGRFETFLRSGAHERHTLLEKLFGTQRFRAVEDWLADHRRRLADRSHEQHACVTGVVERLAEAGGTTGPDVDPDGLLEWSDSLREQTWAEQTRAAELRSAADQRAKESRTALEAAREVAQLQARHRDALGRDADLRALADDTDRTKADIDAAHRARPVQPLLELREAAAARLEATTRACALARGGLPAEPSDTSDVPSRGARPDEVAGVDEPLPLDDPPTVSAALRLAHEEAARLEALLPRQQRAAELGAECERLEARLRQVADDRARLAAEESTVEQTRERVRDARVAATDAAGRLEALQERAARAERTSAAADELPALEHQRSNLVDARQQATETAHRARESWLDLRQARLDGIAAELARRLTEASPCPVCGSVEHPAPADAPADAGADTASTVTPEAEQAAEQAWRRADDERRRVEERLAGCERDLAALEVAADGQQPDHAAAVLAEARDDLARAEEAAARAAELQADLAALEAEASRHAARREELDGRRVQLAERLDVLHDQRADIERSLADAVGEAQSIDGHLHRTRERAATLEHLLEQLRARAEAVKADADATCRLDRALAESGFADVDEARRAMMSPTALSNSETLVRRRADQAAAVRAVLDDPKLIAAARQAPPPLQSLEEAVAAAETSRDDAVAHERTLELRSGRLDQLHAELVDALEAWSPLVRSLAVAERLTTLCAGTSADNRHKMRLSAYVLAARLEQVVAAANERLLRMSSGRYTLRHSVAKGVGDRRGGLGLLVHDGWTGELRDPATLSGGETFFTSLALALGLSDVVTHESGGTEINTLFVDEGFGSLDPDTLDEVMDVLDQLRSGGRAVGIVSHVGELQSRVPVQVHVRKSRAGSTLRVA